MNFKSNLLSFIYDKNYCICMYDNKVLLYKFKEIINFSNNQFIVKVQDKTYKISGHDLKVKKITNNELVIEGEDIEVTHEKD